MKIFKCAFLRFSSIVLQPYSKNVFSLSLITKLIMYITLLVFMYFRCGWKMCRSWERMWRWRMNCTSMAVESCPTSQSVTRSQNLRSSCELTARLPSQNNNPWTNRSGHIFNHFNVSFYFFKTQNLFLEGYLFITWGHVFDI